MRNLIGSIGFVVLAAALAALPAAAQTGAAVVAKEPGQGGRRRRRSRSTATITAIDAATRAVTLKGPQGNESRSPPGPEVKNFAQMKVGDLVNVEYVEALTLELKKGSAAPVARTEQAGAAGGEARASALPAWSGRQVTIIADVVGARRRRSRSSRCAARSAPSSSKSSDPAQFKLVAKGDRVEATYTEAMAIAVTPAKK